MQNLNNSLLKNQFITISKLAFGQESPIEIDQNVKWLNDMLENQCTSDALPGETLIDDKCFLKFDGTLQKTSLPHLKEVILISGELKCTYQTLCVNSLEKMYIDLSFPIKACFIDEFFKTTPEYESEIDISHKEDLYDLYFYDKNIIDVKELFHSYLVLNADPYPKVKDFNEASLR